MDNNTHKDIWVFAEQRNGKLNSATLEILGKCQELKEKSGENIIAVLLGNKVKDISKNLFKYGADKVLLVGNPELVNYNTLDYTKVIVELAKKHNPSIFLFPATSIGKDLAPRVMSRLETGLTADCLDLDIEDGVLIQTKPSYGGNIMCEIVIPDARPQIATIRPGVFEPVAVENDDGELIIENIEFEPDKRVEQLEVFEKPKTSQPIDEAEVVLAGGRAFKSEEELKILHELAELINARVGGSRPLVDEEWMTVDDQIGQSGNTIQPNFLINVGISGAVQYIVGADKSDVVLSINKNENASIFDISNYGVVADYKELLPAIIDEINKR